MFLTDVQNTKFGIEKWIDTSEYIKHYWVQEFSKSPDACFHTSVFFSWENNHEIKMSPIWDFDVSLGGHYNEKIASPQEWLIKHAYWNTYIFKDSIMEQSRINYWNSNKDHFEELTDIIDSLHLLLFRAANNNFKKWNILKSTNFTYYRYSYQSYDDAICDLKEWVRQRILWINTRIRSYGKS